MLSRRRGEKISAWVRNDYRNVAQGQWQAKFPASTEVRRGVVVRSTILHATVDIAPLVEAVVGQVEPTRRDALLARYKAISKP